MTGADAGLKALRVRISGRVQGVWYRGWTVERATAHGLDGWVRNRADGSVEALFSGPAAAVEAMVAECRIGPPAARVREIAVEQDVPPQTGGFHQRSTL
ncbi:MAG: acylphosphatase [Rhodospirillaceae bacterium]